LSDGSGKDPQRARELLHRWSRAGHIIPLKRGVYMTHRFYEAHRTDANFAPAISAILIPLSYVSLEYVLQRAGILTEATYPITAITTKNTGTIQNQTGTFVYRHIKPPLYTGYHQERYYGVIFYRASVAKALFDYLYLRPLPRQLRTRDIDLAEDLRLNLEDFSLDAIEELEAYIQLSASEKMNYILDNLRRNVWRP
jgi:hypothetical protein